MIALPRFRSGTIEAVKWLALALMVVDHVDAFVFHRELLWACALGRLVFPLFAFVLAYHLARPDALQSGVYARVLSRLVVFGAIAQLPHGLLTHATFGLFPLNVLATFSVAVGCMWLLDRGASFLAIVLLFVVGGALVEYSWPGVACCLGVWSAYRTRHLLALAMAGVAFASLYAINGSFLALWALPLLYLAAHLQLVVPRLRWAFYGFYPAHLVAFLVFVLAR